MVGRALGQAEAELALPQADELLEAALDALPEQRRSRLRRQLAVARVERRRLRAEGGHHVAVLEDDGTLSRLRANGEVSRLLAEGDDLQDVEEGKVLEVTVQAHDAVPWASSCIPA
jgi:hypothetical protein